MTDEAQTYTDIVNARKSVRAFKTDPVPQDVLDKVFGAALRAPSNCNTQPWQTHVASGESVEKLRAVLPESFMKGEFTMDLPYDGK
jgi:nitroreductase